jgi:hypothetical protein
MTRNGARYERRATRGCSHGGDRYVVPASIKVANAKKPG